MKIKEGKKPLRIKIEIVFLCLGLLIQIYVVARSFILPSIGLIRDTHILTAQDRSAVIAFGDRHGDYFKWIQENTPENAVLLIPPVEFDEILGHFSVMQFYFIPRRISGCPREMPWDECRPHRPPHRYTDLGLGCHDHGRLKS